MASSDEIENLRKEIDRYDEIIISTIQKRTETSRQIGKIRASEGGPRIVPAREAQIHERYAKLGPEGKAIVYALLLLGRGKVVDS